MEIDEIIKLLEAVKKSGVDTLSYSNDKEKIVIKKNLGTIALGEGTVIPAPVPAVAAAPQAQAAEEPVMLGHVIKSPIVGTFYASPSPDADSFVHVGDRVKKGQVIGIIEAMKLMNELESDYDGVVKEILVSNEDTVEYGQELFVIE